MGSSRCFIVGGAYVAKGVDWAGTNALSRGQLTGLSDGKEGLLSFWFKAAPISSTSDYVIHGGANGRFYVLFTPSDDLYVIGLSSAGSVVLSMNTNIVVMDSAWHHCLMAWRLTGDAGNKVYIDGVDRTTLGTRVNVNIDYSSGDWHIGEAIAGSGDYGGEMAEFWFDDAWMDITDSANREKFAKNGKPVNLGADGSRTTGIQPLIYLRGPASDFDNNRGTGGAFTLSGTLADSTTKPSY